MQANRKYFYVSEKGPIYMLPRSKAPKCRKLRVENQWTFYVTAQPSALALAIISLTEIPLQNFPFL